MNGSARSALRTARILVVDDEPDICTICALALRHAGHTVTTANTPEQALELLRNEPFELLLTDIVMPTMTGLDLMRRAHASQPLVDVIIMTAQASFNVLEDAIQHGVADFLPKPFDVDQLRLTVARTLQRQQLRRENVRLETLTHVIQASKAFATSLDQATVAQALVAAIRRETGLTCVHVVLGTEKIFPTPGAHEPCAYHLEAEREADGMLELPLQAHQKQVGHVWLARFDGQAEPAHSEVLQLLVEHGALALHNAEVYTALQDLDYQKSEFIALASHELRTPLSVVLGYSAMLQDKLEGRQHEQMAEVVQGALRINDLVDDLVNLRELQREERPLTLEPLELRALLATLHEQLQPLADERDITLVTQAPRRPLVFRAERERLLLALAHLVTNAIRFTHKGGRVMITAGCQAPTHGGNLVIAIDDTGIGIEPHEVKRIFRRFYQVSDSRTREQGGLGIGLAVARTITELHGGALQVASEPGRGSRFVVVLPATLIVP